MFRFHRTALAALLGCALAWAPIEEAGAEPSSFTLYGGAAAVNEGFEGRVYTGALLDHYLENDLGLHAEVSGVFREEDAAFFAGGLSYGFGEHVRLKATAGTSSNNDDILPEFYTRGELEIKSSEELGLVARPSITYRNYQSGVDEITPGLDVALYHELSRMNYLVFQVIGSLSYADPGSNLGFEAGGDITWVRRGLFSVGVTSTAGEMAYDNTLAGGPSVAVESEFWTVRPHASLFATKNLEIFARGDFSFNEFYDVTGGLLGVKFTY